MKVVVTSSGADLDARVDPAFGRCLLLVFVDTETMQFEAVDNPAVSAGGGAGIQAAQFVVERGAQAVVTGSVGPNAFQVLEPAGVAVYLFNDGTVRQAVEAFKSSTLSPTGSASRSAHAGMAVARDASPPTPSREEETAALQERARELRKEVAEVLERLDQLEG